MNTPWLLLLVPPLAYLTFTAQRLPVGDSTSPQPQAARTIPKDCALPLHFTPTFQSDPNNVVTMGQGLTFKSTALVAAPVCQPGELVLQLEPQLSGPEAPRLTIGLDEEALGEWPIGQQQELRVRVPRAGRLTLGYFNDYYRSEVRMLTYEQFKLGAPCQTFEVEAPPATGGRYDPATRQASATSDVPIVVKPCAAGTLSFRILGTSAAGETPRLEISQAGKTLRQVTAGARRQLIEVPVGAGPVSLRLLNPYFKEVADRNLLVRSLTFRPTAP